MSVELAEVLEKLEKPLSVEEKTGYRNFAVTGGFNRYMQTWANFGMKLCEGDICQHLSQIAQIFSNYESADLTERRKRVIQARKLLDQLHAILNEHGVEISHQVEAKIEWSDKTQTKSSQSQQTEISLTTNIGTMNQDSFRPYKQLNQTHKSSFSPDRITSVIPKSVGHTVPQFSVSLSDDIRFLKGVGPKRSRLLKRLGVEVMSDFLIFYPRRYEDRRNVKRLAEIVSGEKVVVQVEVIGKPFTEQRKNLVLTKVPVSDGTGRAMLVWFNQPYMEKRFHIGQRWFVFGKAQQVMGQVTFPTPELEEITGNATLQVGRLVPVYPLTEGLSQNFVRTIVQQTVLNTVNTLTETLPETVRQRYSLMPLRQAMLQIHFPTDEQSLESARKRLVFEEFLTLQIVLALRKKGIKQHQGIAFQVDTDMVERFVRFFPFQLTNDQRKVIGEIVEDMQKPNPMNRLLHGEVGSGKTVVAATAIFIAVQNGYQSAFMAPTEILAEQHYRVLTEIFRIHGIEVVNLVGSLTPANKRKMRKRIREGMVQFIVGTHALIEEATEFHRLGLVVVDEQHRFGVMQRANLIWKGQSPDVIIMTATPIPRTLALTVYGDLEVSVIKELPHGRQRAKTYWIHTRKRMTAYDFIRKEIAKGKQAYIVCPLIEESEKLEDVQSVIRHAEWLQKNVLTDQKVGVLHGRMAGYEKDEIMDAFRRNEIQVLVTTTVVEVGVDVPNATVMVIEDAERFGLSQLHQLRGRVERSEHPCFCVLIADPSSEEARERLRVMTKTNDGFVIAEHDLRLRGPGEFLGTRQHGLPDLKLADILHDTEILMQAKQCADWLVELDPTLDQLEHRPLREKVMALEGGAQLLRVS